MSATVGSQARRTVARKSRCKWDHRTSTPRPRTYCLSPPLISAGRGSPSPRRWRRLSPPHRRCARRDLPPGYPPRHCPFAVMEGPDRIGMPTRLPAQFLVDECFQHPAVHLPIAPQGPAIQSQQRAGQPCVDHMQLGRFHQAAQAVGVPRRQLVHQEDPFQKRDIFADGGPAHLMSTTGVSSKASTSLGPTKRGNSMRLAHPTDL